MNHAANSRQISDKEAVVSRKRKLEKEKKTRASMILVFFFSMFHSFCRINFYEETYERYSTNGSDSKIHDFDRSYARKMIILYGNFPRIGVYNHTLASRSINLLNRRSRSKRIEENFVKQGRRVPFDRNDFPGNDAVGIKRRGVAGDFALPSLSLALDLLHNA